MKVEIFLDQQIWNQQTNVFIIGTDQNGRRFQAQPVQMNFVIGDEGKPMEPTLKFDGQMGAEFLQALHDALVNAGFRQKDTSGEAMRNHLEDMRKLVFEQNKTIMGSFDW